MDQEVKCSCTEQDGVHIIGHNKETCENYKQLSEEFAKLETFGEALKRHNDKHKPR